jgi:hypothetical protein
MTDQIDNQPSLRRRLRAWLARLWLCRVIRRRLPYRRPSVTFATVWREHELTATVGFDPRTGAPLEVFGNAKRGAMHATIADAAVLVSVALQCGATIPELRRSLLVETDYQGNESPASPIGAILTAVEEGLADLEGCAL